MTNTREELIEEAAKAIYEAQVEESTYGDLARAALTAFEQAHTPADDEREVLIPAAHREADQRYGTTDWNDGPGSSTFRRVDRGKAGAFVERALWRNRRPVQGEPTDAQVEAAAEVIAVANDDGPWADLLDTLQDEYRRDARAALRAATAVTVQGENR